MNSSRTTVAFDSNEAIPFAAAGTPLPVGWRGELRIWGRSALLALAMLVLVPLHYLFRLVKYGSPFPMYFLRWAAWVIRRAAEASAGLGVAGTDTSRRCSSLGR